MDEEVVIVNEIQVLFWIISIRGDGECLFSSVFYLVHGDISMAVQIRDDIPTTGGASNTSLNNSLGLLSTRRRYFTKMSRLYTYTYDKPMFNSLYFPKYTLLVTMTRNYLRTKDDGRDISLSLRCFDVAPFWYLRNINYRKSNESVSQKILMKGNLMF